MCNNNKKRGVFGHSFFILVDTTYIICYNNANTIPPFSPVLKLSEVKSMATNEFNIDQRILSKISISIALVELMKTKPYEEISVTEIVKKAGVSRNAYYRNFESKNDVLIEFLKSCFFRELLSKFDNEDIVSAQNWDMVFFNHIYEYHEYFKVIFMHSEVYPLLIRFLHEYFIAPEVNNAFEAYDEIGRIGMRISVISAWVIRGCKETPEEMVAHIKKYRENNKNTKPISISQLIEKIRVVDN